MSLPIKILALLLFAMTFTQNTHAQKVMLHQEVDTSAKKFGPNRQMFIHFFVRGEVLFGKTTGTGLNLKPLGSMATVFGFRFKQKINRTFSAGMDAGIENMKFSLQQGEAYPFPDTLFGQPRLEHKKAKFNFLLLPVAGWFRLNFDPKRGDNLGTYIDIGGNLAFMIQDKFQETDNLNGGGSRKTSYTNMPFFSPVQAGAFARFGTHWFGFTAGYRFTNLFKTSMNLPEFPRFQAGLELSLAY